MTDIKYKLRYLSLFYEDLEQKVLYISAKLQNAKAANDLNDAVEETTLKRQNTVDEREKVYEKEFSCKKVNISNNGNDHVVIFHGKISKP